MRSRWDRERARAAGLRLLGELTARPLHVGLFALVTGLLTGPRTPVLAVALAGAALASGSVLAAAGTSRRCDASGGPGVGPAGTRCAGLAVAAALLVLVGATVGGARVAALERSQLGPDIGHVVAGTAVVQEAPRRSDFGGWFAVVRLRGEPVLLRVGEDAATLPPPGALLAVHGALRAPGDFARIRRVHAELRADRAAVVGHRGGAAGVLDGVRGRAEAALDRGLPAAASGLLRGMVLGEDAALPDGTRDDFRAAGLSHLVAASGTNVVLLAALATAFGAAIGLGLSGRLWLVLGLIAVYVPLAGGGASIQRAGIMGAAAVAAGLAGRPASRWYALGLAAAVTLVIDPRAAGDPGWQLSFVAVLSLLVLAPRWRAALVRGGLPRVLADVTAMTAAATLATAPIVAAHFGRASLASVPANLLAAPVVAPIMWLGVVAGALGQLTVLGGAVEAVVGVMVGGLDAVMGFPLGYLVAVARAAASAPGAVVEVGPWPVLVVGGAVIAGLCSHRARRILPLLAVVAAAGWIGLAPATAAPPGAPVGFRLTFLDVGQGEP